MTTDRSLAAAALTVWGEHFAAQVRTETHDGVERDVLALCIHPSAPVGREDAAPFLLPPDDLETLAVLVEAWRARRRELRR